MYEHVTLLRNHTHQLSDQVLTTKKDLVTNPSLMVGNEHPDHKALNALYITCEWSGIPGFINHGQHL